MTYEPNMKVKAELSKWINEDAITDRRVVDKYGTEIVITTHEARYRVLRGFTLGDGAAVSVDLHDATIEQVVTHLLSKYES